MTVLTTPAVNYLDLDALAATITKTVKLKGVEHTIVPISVETFIENLVDARSLPDDAGMKENLDLTIRILCRSIPSMKEADLRGVTMEGLNVLLEFAKENNGSKKMEAEVAETAAANPSETTTA